ncbi:MAG: BatA domain-containing protein [Bryobacteraceae bacterium]|nr:BatA domain-containing protein [Bryobacteraceae bacterium]
MGLLAPWFLAGLAALGLPVWLHLLRQHKTTPKQFSSLMFFEPRTQSSIKHRRLKYIALMVARLLLLLLLVLAFANPFIRGSNLGAAARKRLLIAAIDNSFSMRVADRLGRAKQQALGVLNGRNSADLAQVLTINAAVQSLTQPTAESGELIAAVESIEPSHSRSSYGEFARALRAIEQSNRMPLEVHLFSDMQKSSLPPAFADLNLGGNTKLVIHSLADRNTANWTVETVTAPRSVFDPKKARVIATVAGFHTPAAKRTLTLLVNNKTVASNTVDVPENGRATAEFIGMEASYGFNRGEVRIDAADQLAADDSFVFSVERSDPRSVLFVHEARQGRGLLYYRAALESASEGAFAVEPVTVDQAANIGLSKYGFVVLSDTGPLPPAFEQTLQKYVREGGALLVALGPSSAGQRKVPVLDQPIVESRYASRAAERFLVAGSLDTTHPVLRAAGRWENVKFYQAIRVEPGEAKVLARLADETPLLLEKRVGEGRVMVFTSTFDNISNDFPLRPFFVPFVEQSAGYLTGAEVRASSYTVDSHVELRAEKGAGTVEVLNPQGKRALSLNEAASARSLPLTEGGFYDIGRANGRHELVAVNSDRKESDLEMAPKETIELWQGTETRPATAAATGQTTAQQNANLWWYVMLAAVLLALAESLLAGNYLTAQKESA